jgi:hypothetical protein
MEKTKKNNCLHTNILQTLRLAEKRGYNLSLEQLSQQLIGGQIPLPELVPHLNTFNDIDSDGVFIATKGNLQSEKCRQRQESNRLLQPKYRKIVSEFIEDYLHLSPWIHCILLSGSMASEGIGYEDDIDLDIIVHDGFKYSSYFLALLLSLKYSLKYGNQFCRHYVICISIIWENHQVFPFMRKDGQMAFELLNAKVVYNHCFFDNMIAQNTWLKSYFPQLYNNGEKNSLLSSVPLNRKKKQFDWVLETCSKCITFILVKMGMFLMRENHEIMKRNIAKQPYTFFDVSEKG